MRYLAVVALILFLPQVVLADDIGVIPSVVRRMFNGDVDGSGATTGQVLIRQADGSWKPGTPSGATTSGWDSVLGNSVHTNGHTPVIDSADSLDFGSDCRLHRTGTKQVEFDDAANGQLDFVIEGGSTYDGGLNILDTGHINVGSSGKTFADPTKGFYCDKDEVDLGRDVTFQWEDGGGTSIDARLRRSGAKTVTFDDGGGGAATLAVTGTLTASTPIAATSGGTGSSSFVVGDLLYCDSSNHLTKLGIGTTNYVLTVVGGAPSWQPASGGSNTRTVTAKTTSYSVLSGDTNTVFTNAGAGGTVIFTLPTWSSGLTYTFVIEATQTLEVLAPGSDTITIGNSTTAGGGNFSASTAGYSLTIVATASGKWRSVATTGTWN